MHLTPGVVHNFPKAVYIVDLKLSIRIGKDNQSAA